MPRGLENNSYPATGDAALPSGRDFLPVPAEYQLSRGPLPPDQARPADTYANTYIFISHSSAPTRGRIIDARVGDSRRSYGRNIVWPLCVVLMLSDPQLVRQVRVVPVARLHYDSTRRRVNHEPLLVSSVSNSGLKLIQISEPGLRMVGITLKFVSNATAKRFGP